MVLCIMQNVPDNILNVRELSGVVREHLGSTSWTQPILNPALFDGIQSCTTHGVQKHKCVPTYTMALEGIWSARMFPLRITGLAFLCQWIALTKCTELTHNYHVELLPSQLSTLIASPLEHRSGELTRAWSAI